MSRDLSKAYLVGNVGGDPETRTVGDGTKVASFSLAVNRKRGQEEHTDWYRVSAWRGLADVVERYVRKGSRVMVDGPLSIRQYESNGKQGTSVELDARDLVLLDPPTDSNRSSGASTGNMANPFAETDSMPF